MKLLPSEIRGLAAALAANPAFRSRITRDGKVDTTLVRAELARQLENVNDIEGSLAEPTKVGKKSVRGWAPLKQPSAGSHSGHRKDTSTLGASRRAVNQIIKGRRK